MLRNGHVRFGGRAAETTSRKTGTALLPDPYSYVWTLAGFVYVAFILDVFSQRIVGWHAATDRRTDLVMTPLRDRAIGTATAKAARSSPANCCTTVTPAANTSIRFTEHLQLESAPPRSEQSATPTTTD